jgi:hypothetical protein
MRPTYALARQIAQREYDQSGPAGFRDWVALRETVEHSTGGELDAAQLDMLTDWTADMGKAIHNLRRD